MGATGVLNLRHTLAVIIIAAFVIGGCAEGDRPQGPSLSATEPTPPAIPPWPGAAAVVVEHFDADVFRPASGVSEWTIDGPWRVRTDTDVAALGEDLDRTGRSVALVDLGGPHGFVQATFPVTADGAGLTFRYVGPANHWAIVGAPTFGTWNLVRVTNGEETLVTNLGSVDAGDGATIGVVLDDDAFSITVDGALVHTEIDAGNARGTRVGLWAGAPSAQAARWDDFIAIRAADLDARTGSAE